MKKRFLFVVCIFVLVITTPLIVLAENGGGGNTDPEYIVRAIHQEYKEGKNEYPMVLVLKNNTNKSITVTGAEEEQLTILVKPNPMAVKESFKFKLYREAKQIEIGAGEEKPIVEVPAGGTDCWNAFYHPSLTTDMDVKIKIDDIEQTFKGINYGITGVIRNPLYIGKIIPTDNEDGTVTLKFKLNAYEEENKVDCNGNQCDLVSLDPKEKGLKTGLKKSDFSIQKDGRLLGNIIQTKEIAAGEYEVVWQHEVGIYEQIVLNTASNYGDFFVWEIPKDDNGKYILDKRNNTFEATITHTKEPIVIKHDDATFETAGATNIPKLVKLFFKEVKNEIDEESMNELGKIIQKTNANREIVHIYDIGLRLDGEEIQPNGNVKITIPLDEQMKKYTDLKVVYISDAGEITEVKFEITDNEISFITNHFSCYAVLGTSKGTVPESPKTGDSAIYYVLSIGTIALIGMGIVSKKEYIK